MTRKLITLLLSLAALGLLGLGQIALAADPPGVVEAYCGDACSHKVCRPTVDTRQVPKRVYDDTCEEFCLPKCSLFGGFFRKGCDGDGACGSCEHPHKRKYLIVKIRYHEECVNKCVLEEHCPAPPPCVLPAPSVPASATQPMPR